MSYSHVNVKLSDGQIEKLKSKDSVMCGTKITLKHEQMSGGPHKLSLTKTQFGHFNKSKSAVKGIQLTLSKAAVNEMIKSGGIFPLAAFDIPTLKALGLGAAGVVGSNLVEKDFWERRYKKRERDSDYREASAQNTTGSG